MHPQPETHKPNIYPPTLALHLAGLLILSYIGGFSARRKMLRQRPCTAQTDMADGKIHTPTI